MKIKHFYVEIFSFLYDTSNKRYFLLVMFINSHTTKYFN